MRFLLAGIALFLLGVFSTVSLLIPVILVCAGIGFLLRSSRRPHIPPLTEYPSVSVIIPARNEEATIEASISSLAELKYPDLEVLIVDDRSTDRTAAIIQKTIHTRAGDRDFRLLTAPAEPPEGWVGKTFAADYAIKQSTGSVILISDADVLHSPQSLQTSVAQFMSQKAALMARPPFLDVRALSEYPLLVLVFIIKFGSFVAHTLGSRQSFAMGTYLMFTRAFYEQSGGWNAHRSFPESLPLANYAIAHGEKFVFMDDDYKEITTRMYIGGRATARGMIRNINFSLLQPLPFAISFFLLAAAGNALLALVFGVSGGTATLLALMALFGAYLAESRYPLTTATAGAVLLPVLLLCLFCIAALAGLRHVLPLSVGWRDRSMFVQ